MDDMDRGLGKCVELGCGRWAVVGLNGRAVCLNHFEANLAHANEVLRRSLGTTR